MKVLLYFLTCCIVGVVGGWVGGEISERYDLGFWKGWCLITAPVVISLAVLIYYLFF